MLLLLSLCCCDPSFSGELKFFAVIYFLVRGCQLVRPCMWEYVWEWESQRGHLLRHKQLFCDARKNKSLRLTAEEIFMYCIALTKYDIRCHCRCSHHCCCCHCCCSHHCHLCCCWCLTPKKSSEFDSLLLLVGSTEKICIHHQEHFFQIICVTEKWSCVKWDDSESDCVRLSVSGDPWVKCKRR